LHDGFFIQRCAEQLSALAEGDSVRWPKFEDFLQARAWRTVKEKKAADFAAELPSLKSAYNILLDYASRTFSFGRFSPKKLLSSDSHDAVKICNDYAQFILKSNKIILIVREVQHCDLHSLRTFLSLSEYSPRLHLILEYTSLSGIFDAPHQKIFLRFMEAKENFCILDLVQLEFGHLNYLIQNTVSSDFALTTEAYLSWNGNLRSIIEMKFQVMIAQTITKASQLDSLLGGLTKSIDSHLTSLSSLEKFVLAICFTHVEAISEWMIASTVSLLSPLTTPKLLKQALADLTRQHGFLAEREGNYRIHDETIADTLDGLLSFRSLIALAEKALRERYKALVSDSSSSGIAIGSAIRQVFRLCARTKDVVGLSQAVDILSKEIKRAHDQSIYVEMVATAIAADPALFANDQGDLVMWAASMAYDIGDWERAESLVAMLPSPNMVCLAMRACALQEIGRHDEALVIAQNFRSGALDDDERLAADLIEAIIVGCRGDQEAARERLNAIVGDPKHSNSPLLGYAHRFFEVVEEYSGCIEHLYHSIAHFERFGLKKSKAYSQAATAVLIARSGEIPAARTMITEAVQILAEDVQDRHLLLNNLAAVDLLSDLPDFSSCRNLLIDALRYVRDDYSEVTVLSNLALAYWGDKDWKLALDCVNRILSILDHHDFADIEIYWPLCFNAGKILLDAGRMEDSQKVLQIPQERGRPVSANQSYWAYAMAIPAPSIRPISFSPPDPTILCT